MTCRVAQFDQESYKNLTISICICNNEAHIVAVLHVKTNMNIGWNTFEKSRVNLKCSNLK